ncbi:transmembrane 220 family protein [Flavihumibacter fluvii]|uniref:transmembrane 220 family protein n=1 Tax=Flavihumibacter fluvii TaxID=2838157 RepID=UPI001BDE39E4|nr:transmembrane 220 family protein [Flavihumibacter fluvii]ULQ51098.1 transmembrane 220 family protein [Flavihumibacter fluvii]
MERFRKIFNGVMVVLFLLSALLQYNDPDPYVWVPLYGAGAWLSYQALSKKFKGWLYACCGIVYAAYAAFLFFTSDGVLSWFNEHHADNLVQTMKATKPWIEQTREFGGLLILLTSLLINWFLFRKTTNSGQAVS